MNTKNFWPTTGNLYCGGTSAGIDDACCCSRRSYSYDRWQRIHH